MEITMSKTLETKVDRGAVMVEIDGMTFAQRLRDAREKAGYTQEQVAELCGVTDGAVSAWERGQAEKIAAQSLFRVADLLRVDARWLVLGESRGDEQSASISREIEGLPDDQQAIVLALIRSLKR